MSDDSQDEYIEQNQSILDPSQMGEELTELDKIFDHMTKLENLHHYTELNSSEITAFSTLGVLAKKYDIQLYKDWIIENLKLRVSKKREGRRELVKVTARNAYQDQPQQQTSGMNFFRR